MAGEEYVEPGAYDRYAEQAEAQRAKAKSDEERKEKARLEAEQKKLEQDRKKTINIHNFDEQAFLMFNLRKLAPLHNNTHSFVHGTYEKIDLLKGQNTALLNRLLNADFFKKEALLNLTPAQISELVPHIRLYKQYYTPNQEFKEEVEFEFPAYIGAVVNAGDVLKDIGRSSYGIQSFDIETQGTTFYTADKQFTAKLELFFQSFDQLTAKRTNRDNKTYTFLDLIVQPPAENPELPKVSDAEPAVPKKHRDVFSDPHAFIIRADIGWSVSGLGPNSAFSEKERQNIAKALRNSRLSFLLYTPTHEININENGTLTLSLNYVGAFDFAQRDVRAGIILTNALKKELDDLSQLIQEATKTNDKEQIEFVRQQLVSRQTTISKEAFESIVRELLEGNSGTIVGSGTTYSKVYQTCISRRAASHFAAFAIGEQAPPITITQTKTELVSYGRGYGAAVEKATKTKTTATVDFCNLEWLPQEKIDNGISYTVFKPIQIEPFENVSLYEFMKDPIIVDGDGQEYLTLSWFYLGDLMEILMERAFDTQVSDTEGLVRRFGKDFSKRVKLILSDVQLTDYCSGERIRVNLAHIPISMKKFTVFFYNKIITARNLNYTVDDFIRDMLNDLVKDIFLDRSYIAGRKLKQQIKLNYINLGVFSKEKGIDPLFPKAPLVEQLIGDLVPVESVNADKFLRSSTIERNPENYYYYLMIYQDVYDPLNFRGDYEEDRKRGIPHVFMGRDRGIVKKVTFRKNPIPYDRERRIAEEGKSFDPVVALASLYDVDMETYGNSLFLLGTYFFLVPTGMGGGLGLPNKAGSLANLMGLGGYYFINKITWSVASGRFTNNISGRHQATGDPSAVSNKELYVYNNPIGITDKATQ